MAGTAFSEGGGGNSGQFVDLDQGDPASAVHVPDVGDIGAGSQYDEQSAERLDEKKERNDDGQRFHEGGEGLEAVTTPVVGSTAFFGIGYRT